MFDPRIGTEKCPRRARMREDRECVTQTLYGIGLAVRAALSQMDSGKLEFVRAALLQAEAGVEQGLSDLTRWQTAD